MLIISEIKNRHLLEFFLYLIDGKEIRKMALKMYMDHPLFEKPIDENAIIWRYMDFSRFVYLLSKKALFFASPFFLDDQFEGTITEADLEENKYWNDNFMDIFPKNDVERLEKQKSELRKHDKLMVCVNCWHVNDFESAAMWRLYSQTKKGIAIRSTFKKLTESFNEYNENDVYVGLVKYIDYSKERIPNDHFIHRFFHKRKSFCYENELRAVISRIPINYDKKISEINWASFNRGLAVQVNVENLIDRIFVAPSCEDWFYELVKSVTREYLSDSLSGNVHRSDIDRDPIY